ncbi:MAG: alcohol dehydrogenase catalytic domain-containing protein [Thermodesulfobacteriota bacterium]
MQKTSRAVVLTGPKTLEMQSYPLPEIGEEDGLLEVELVGVCGSDPGIYKGATTFGPRPFPLILGHEIVGRVKAMGAGARMRHGVEIGDRVVIEYAMGCGACQACLGGNYTTCENKRFYGSMITSQTPPHLYGGYSEYLYIDPLAKVHKIGDDISPEVGVLICAVLANGVRWLRQIGGVSIGDTVAIVGPGQQGLAATAVAKESGANPIFVVGLSRDAKRLDMAKRFGADQVIVADQEDPVQVLSQATGGRMANVVMDATGHPSGPELALSLAGRRATVVLPGMYKAPVTLYMDRAVLNEIRLQGVFSQDFRAVGPAIKMARQGRYPLEELITHRLPLEQAEYGIKLVAGQVEGELPLKVVLDPKL